MSEAPLLRVEDLQTYVHTDDRTVRAVDRVSFDVERGETVCLVGESGSGKSVTCESLTGVVPTPPAEIVGGDVVFDGRSLIDLDGPDLREIRGDRIAHVFQNPQGSLDPVYTVGEQVVEAIRIHRGLPAAAARERGVDLLRRVGIPNPGERFEEYPHEFSGGQRQRIAIAVALAADPDLVIADEPTTSVDVTVQARLIELLGELTDGGAGMLWVTHDLRVVAAVADRVLVMFGGTIVERGPVEAVFDSPGHPYTRALFDSYRVGTGNAGSTAGKGVERAESTAREDVPTDGCRFREECPHALSACARPEQPEFLPVEGRADHTAACVYHGTGFDAATVLGDPPGVNRKPGPDEETGERPEEANE